MSLTGRTLGDFTIHDKIGEGGYGVVYRAEQRALGREAVIKVLHVSHHANTAMVQRFLREARLASRLDHPFAAHIYAFGAEPDGLLWIAMELVRGTTLRKLLEIQPGGRLPITRLVPLLDGLCEVVHTAHEQGIVHRDLKPDNIMVVSRAGRLLPKLLDLGIAKLVGPAPASRPSAGAGARATPEMDTEALAATLAPPAAPASDQGALTLQGMMLGSPHYMAPEQWHEDCLVDPRADLYALGVIAYEMATGQVPFSGGSLAEIATGHLRDEPPALPAELPAALDPVLRRALAKRPDERFATALAFAGALRQAAGLRLSTESLPRFDDELRAQLAWMPQPVADAVAVFEAARNPHQSHDALWELVHVIVRWLGVVALAARSQVDAGTPDASAVISSVRELHRRELTDEEWLELIRGLTQPFRAIRDAYPLPELVDLAAAEPSPFAALLALRAGESAAATEESMRDQLARMVPALAALLRTIEFLTSYQVVVPCGDRGAVWMGPQRAVWPVIEVSPELAAGTVVLADFDGRLVLQLSPLVHVAPASPGGPDELFVFTGTGRGPGQGARFVAAPHGFERHDGAVWEWFRSHLLAVDRDAAAIVEDAPYRGLATFTERDAEVFFGRERAAEAFINRLVIEPLLAVVGPSGAGKSSFVRAGVIPALPVGWRAVVLRPGAAPMAALAARELAPASGETVLVVVDQLEEMFTLCRDPAERARFAAAVAELASTGGDQRRVVLTVRDDFLARTGELPGFRERLARGITLLATPDRDDLLRIVIEPARRAGYHFDGDLPERMVREVAGQPGALALLSFTAARLWDLRDRHFRRLGGAAYDAIGGVEGALAQHAEDTLRGCTAEEQRLVREAFRHLATAEGTRAVLTRAELDDVLGGPGATAVTDRLIDARLLVAAEGADSARGSERIEVVHEALLSAWPRLVEWRRADAEGARLRDQLRVAARQWDERGRPRGLLWRDEALDDYLRWRARWPGALPELERAFGETSAADARRRRRIGRGLAGAAAVLLAAAVVTLALLNRAAQRNAAAARAEVTRSRIAQGQQYLLEGDYLRALPYLAAAYEDGDRSVALRFMLHRAMQLADTPPLYVQNTTKAVTYRAGGRELIALGRDGDGVVFDAATGRKLAELAAPIRNVLRGRAAAVTMDGELAATSRDDRVVLWDGRTEHSLPVAEASQIAFDDAGHVAISTPRELSVWDTRSRTRAWQAPLTSEPSELAWAGSAVAVMDRKGRAQLVGPGGTIDLGEVRHVKPAGRDMFAMLGATRLELRDSRGAVVETSNVLSARVFAMSPDRKRVAIGFSNGVVQVLSADGRLEHTLAGHTIEIKRAQFTRDGARLVTAGDDQTVRVWDVRTGRQLTHYVGLNGTALDLQVSADEQWIVVGTTDGIRQFRIEDPAVRRTIDLGEMIGAAQISTAGTRMLATVESAVELWDLDSQARLAHLDVRVFDGAHMTPDATLAAIPITESNVVELRELPAGTLRGRITSSAAIWWAALDGRRIATTNTAGLVELWDMAGAGLATLRGHTTTVQSASFSPDSRWLVSAGNDHRARIWDLATYREVGSVEHKDEVYSAVFDLSGTRLVTASNDRTIGLWNARTFEHIHSFEHRTPIRVAGISADAQLIAGGATDGTVHIWDTATRQELGRLHHGGKVTTVQFTARGLFTTSFDHRAIFWDVGMEVLEVARVTAFVRCHTPYRLVDTVLLPAILAPCE